MLQAGGARSRGRSLRAPADRVHAKDGNVSGNKLLDRRLAAVTGASGFLGDELVARLITRRPVRALYRKPSDRSAALHGHGCDVVPGDLDNERALAALVAGADEVYHCAATMARTDAVLSHRVNVEGTERVARAAAAAGVRRFVYVSSTSVYTASLREDNTYAETFEPEHVERLNSYSRTKYRRGAGRPPPGRTRWASLHDHPSHQHLWPALAAVVQAMGAPAQAPARGVRRGAHRRGLRQRRRHGDGVGRRVGGRRERGVQHRPRDGQVEPLRGRRRKRDWPLHDHVAAEDRSGGVRGDRPRVHHIHTHQDVAVTRAPRRVPARQGPRRVRLLPSGTGCSTAWPR